MYSCLDCPVLSKVLNPPSHCLSSSCSWGFLMHYFFLINQFPLLFPSRHNFFLWWLKSVVSLVQLPTGVFYFLFFLYSFIPEIENKIFVLCCVQKCIPLHVYHLQPVSYLGICCLFIFWVKLLQWSSKLHQTYPFLLNH